MSRPVEFFLRHAHFHQITPALAEVSKSQAVSPLRVYTRARTHTHTLRARQKGDALEPRHKPCSRSGALGWSGKIQARIQTPLNVHQTNGCHGGPLGGKRKGTRKEGDKKTNQDSLQGTTARAWKPGAARGGSPRRELGFLPLGPSEGRRPRERKRPALSPARCPFVTATRPSSALTPTPRG